MKLFLFALLAILLCAQTLVFGEEDSADYGLDGADSEAVARAVRHFKRSAGEDCPDDGSGAVSPPAPGGPLDSVIALLNNILNTLLNALLGGGSPLGDILQGVISLVQFLLGSLTGL